MLIQGFACFHKINKPNDCMLLENFQGNHLAKYCFIILFHHGFKNKAKPDNSLKFAVYQSESML